MTAAAVAARWLNPEEAARYVGLTSDAFRRRVKAATMPQPTYAHGPRNPRWDRVALDAAMTGAPPSQRRPLSGAVHAVLAEGRQKIALRR